MDLITQNTVIAGDTLLKIDCKETYFDLANIPSMSDVRKIGGGAFIDCDKLVNIEIPKNVREIGSRAFSRCHLLRRFTMYGGKDVVWGRDLFMLSDNVRNITLKDICMSREEYEKIRYRSMTLDKKYYVALSFPEKYLPQNFGEALSRKPVVYIPDNCTSLLMRKDRGRDHSSVAVFRTSEYCDNVKLRESENIVVEENEVSRIIKEGMILDIPTSIEEKINAFRKRKGNNSLGAGGYVFSFDNSSAKEEGGNVHFDLSIWIDQIFVPSVKVIKMDGITYYLYSRLFLSATGEYPLIPQDVAIYKGSKRLYDTEEGMRVYAKFKLSEML